MHSEVYGKAQTRGFGREAEEKIESIKTADIVVDIPSYNAGGSVAYVAETVKRGLIEHFPNHKSVVVISDGGSSDNTLSAAEKAAQCEELETVCFCYRGISGKGSAVRAILETAQKLGAKACVMVDADLRSITPEWMKLMLSPVLDGGYDFVTPYYIRHKYDGTITKSIIYPLTRALYGKDIRQPIGGDYAFSDKFAGFCLEQNVWEGNVARFGIDIWLTTTAIANGFNICEASLGLKIHDAKDPGTSLGPMFKQVVGTIFGLTGKHKDVWMKNSSYSREGVEVFGEKKEREEPEETKIDVPKLVENFQKGVLSNYHLWQYHLPENILREIAAVSKGHKGFSKELWAKIVCSFAAAYQKIENDEGKEKLVESLVPLYFGYVASYAKETENMSTLEAEELVEALYREFLRGKKRLAESWEKSRQKALVASGKT